MNWGSFENFLHMDGYRLYVWGSYAVTLAILVAEPLLARARYRRARAEAAAEHGGSA